MRVRGERNKLRSTEREREKERRASGDERKRRSETDGQLET